jgi:hypothetical protein
MDPKMPKRFFSKGAKFLFRSSYKEEAVLVHIYPSGQSDEFGFLEQEYEMNCTRADLDPAGATYFTATDVLLYKDKSLSKEACKVDKGTVFGQLPRGFSSGPVFAVQWLDYWQYDENIGAISKQCAGKGKRFDTGVGRGELFYAKSLENDGERGLLGGQAGAKGRGFPNVMLTARKKPTL